MLRSCVVFVCGDLVLINLYILVDRNLEIFIFVCFWFYLKWKCVKEILSMFFLFFCIMVMFYFFLCNF